MHFVCFLFLLWVRGLMVTNVGFEFRDRGSIPSVCKKVASFYILAMRYWWGLNRKNKYIYMNSLLLGFYRKIVYTHVEDTNSQRLLPYGIFTSASHTLWKFHHLQSKTPGNSTILNRGNTNVFWKSPILLRG